MQPGMDSQRRKGRKKDKNTKYIVLRRQLYTEWIEYKVTMKMLDLMRVSLNKAQQI